MKKILVVGLGLIGGSLAMALRGFEDFEVVGAVRSQSTYSKAAERHAADRLTFDPAGELPGAGAVYSSPAKENIADSPLLRCLSARCPKKPRRRVGERVASRRKLRPK